jgi:hypothetical protein
METRRRARGSASASLVGGEAVAPQRGGWERAATHHAFLQQRLGGVELAVPAEKVTADPVEKAIAGRSGG